jgi:hypothetical protein
LAVAPTKPLISDNAYICRDKLNNQLICTPFDDEFANPEIPQKITINVLLQSGEFLVFSCKTSPEKLICTPNSLDFKNDSIKLDSWKVMLPSPTGFLFYICKYVDNQLVCIAEDKSAWQPKPTSPVSTLTVVVPLSSNVMILFDCLKHVEDLKCTPNKKNTAELDKNDLYEIEVPTKDGPQFYVCQYIDKQLLCTLGKSVLIDDNMTRHSDESIFIKMPSSDGGYDILSCVDSGQELLCHHTDSNGWDADKEMVYKR